MMTTEEIGTVAPFDPPPVPGRKTIRLLYALRGEITFMSAKRGRGKTTSMVAIAYWLRELFGHPTVLVGTDMGIKPSFGPYRYLSTNEFKEQLLLLHEFSEDPMVSYLEGGDLEAALHDKGIVLYKAAILWDEAYKLTSARKPMDPMVQAIDTFVSQSRHYKSTLILSSRALREVDWRIREQVDWKAVPTFNKRKGTIRIVFDRDSDLSRFDLTINGEHYWQMFDSWNILGYAGHKL